VETLPRERLRSLQADQLRSLIGYVKGRVALYGKRLVDVEPDDIASLDDLRHLPFTRKADLRDTYPFGMFAVERDEVIRIHASSARQRPALGRWQIAAGSRPSSGPRVTDPSGADLLASQLEDL